MEYSYVVTAHRPTAVSHALTCSLYGELPNLVIAKGTRIEVHTISPDEGLALIADVPLHGRIAALRVFRPLDCTHDRLFLLTQARRYATLSFDGARFLTHAHGDLSDRIGRACDTGPVGHVEPACRAIACHLYDGLLKVRAPRVARERNGGVKWRARARFGGARARASGHPA